MKHLPEAFFLTIFGLVAILPADTRKYAESQPVSHPVHVTAYKPDVGINSMGDHPIIAGVRPVDQYQDTDPTNVDPTDYWLTPWGLLTLFTAAACFVAIFWLKRENYI